MAWEIDAAHSQATFAVKHMMISTVKGHFNVLSGSLHIDEQNPANSWVEAQVEAASIDTRDATRDGHLRSPDFFDAEKYPAITFKSTKVEHVEGDEYKVTGDLTIRNVTKPVVLKAEYTGQSKDPWGNTRAGLTATGKIDRTEFGMTFNTALETGGVMVSNDVKVEIDLEAVNKG
ncbi:polyisoprenoid-binding protein [Reticulibacter mediterranei]|uniref:Polyisoprenoid-binding protein n=1 Tax=Reticulibacter mediterranei TaxID=2778369 RepID=A0A8J3INT9_9CHLR|nr:YceI family protein [Reticulibacter mediterranei]GHO94170.1 polyisoprenoid-binding protein [Reticulibacter mediterranei]